jgi:uncharacterized protein YjbI with pentapeptide repeats
MGANLGAANLSGADLRRADLSRATLFGSNLSAANLDETDLYRVKFFRTIIADVDLSTCKNLDSVDHLNRSTVDTRTLQRSGSLPLSFLRGVGLPDMLIEYLPSLLG